MTQYEWEDMADSIIEDLHAFVDTESRFVQAEHELHEKLVFCDYIMAHLDERIPKDQDHLHELNQAIIDRVIEIRELIESGKLHDLSIIREEENLLQHLEDDVKHREWKAVKKHEDAELKDEKKALRLEIHELEGVHSGFKDILHLLKKSTSAIDADMASPKQKEEYEKKEHYYFVQIYRFASTYERIFRHLIDKEQMLNKKLKKESP